MLDRLFFLLATNSLFVVGINMHSICRFVNNSSSHGHPHVSASFPMSIIQDGNRDRNKSNVIDNKVCQGQAGAHAQQHEKLGKPDIFLKPYRKRFVTFPN